MLDSEKGFIDYLYILVKWRKLILLNFFIVSIFAAGISLILPKWYSARTVVLPPISDSGNLGFGSILSKLPMSGLGIGGMTEETSHLMAIANSRTVMESVIRKFNLQQRYKTLNSEETIRELRKKTFAEITENGSLIISDQTQTTYWPNKEEVDETRELAKDIANFMTAAIDSVSKKLRSEKAANIRSFIEKRYHKNQEELFEAEERFEKFQNENGVIALPEQTTATISAAAELKAQIISKEVQMGVLENYVDKTQADLIKIKNELRELQKRYDQFRTGEENVLIGNKKYEKRDIFLPLDKVPELGLQYARLFREVKLQETILEFLLPQYEQAKIQEAKDSPTIQILDKAVKPVKRIKPKRAFFVIFWSAVSILVSLFIIFPLEYISELKKTAPHKYEKVVGIFHLIKNDFKIFTKKSG